MKPDGILDSLETGLWEVGSGDQIPILGNNSMCSSPLRMTLQP